MPGVAPRGLAVERRRLIHLPGGGGRLIFEGWQVADDGGQTAWIGDAGAIAVFGQPLSPGETTEAGPLWVFARALGERYEPA